MSSENEEEDDFITYGTPLDPLNEDEIPKKRAVTVEDQVAKDKHGRRRFHGAFTGGFSAGFFNTVGSLEGWKPTQFTSSRAERSNAQIQRAEDFMDDEDMDEFGIAPKILQPRANYKQVSESSGRKRPLMQFSEGPIPGVPVLKTLVEPVRETIGIKMLMKMGWKSGQGVGPRLTQSEKSTVKKTQKSVRIYGCALPIQGGHPDTKNEDVSKEEEEGEEDVIPDDVTFAPDDYEPYIVKPKDNCFGLGYSGLDRRPVLSSHVNLFGAGPSLIMEEKKKKVSIRGQAFGVGAFENEDDDIYAKDDMSQYDFALDTPKMMAEKRKQERNSHMALPSSSSDILEGFVKVVQPVVQKAYPRPLLPQGFRPIHCTKQSRFSSVVGSSVQAHSRLTANERAVLVNTDPPVQHKPPTQENKASSVQVEKPTGCFRPFVADPEKQNRYEQFLTLTKLGQSDKLRSLQPITMTDWEAERERGEFEQASRLYRPLSAAFSDRFVSASQPDNATDPLAPVARTAGVDQDIVEAAKRKMFGRLTRRISEWQPHNTLCKRFNIPPPGRSSSSGSMSVKSSRPKFSIFNFLDAAPFNAPTKGIVDLKTSDTIPPTSESVEATPPNTKDSKREAINNNVDDIDKLVESTNKMDLYKAIFLSSSDESDGEDEKQSSTINSAATSGESSTQRNNSPPKGIFANLELLHSQSKASSVECLEKTGKEVNILRNTSPPRGIFANLDRIITHNKILPVPLDKSTTEVQGTQHFLDKGISVTDSNKDVGKKKDYETQLNAEPHTDERAMYGPILPQAIPQLRYKANCVSKDSSSDSGEWVEQVDSSDSSSKNHRNTSKKKQKRAHKKSKKHKEKKKHKHKRKKDK